MISPPTIFDRALSHIHHRWIVIRTLERIGICILIACAISLVLSSILLYRGESALSLSCASLSIGLIAGAAVGWICRPTLFDTAIEIDRQLHLADLLATALSIRQSKTVIADDLDTQWSATIVALAEARCMKLENEALMLHRLGVRAWGGIGICTLAALALGVMSTNPLVLQARSTPQASLTNHIKPERNPHSRVHADDALIDPRQQPEPESSQRSHIESAQDSDASRAHESTNASTVSTDHSGPGAGRSDSSSQRTDFAGNSNSAASNSGKGATGGGRASDTRERGDGSSGSATDGSHPAAPPWNSDDWPRAQQRAGDALRQGDIPDAYRDLVRDYFTR